MRTTIVCHCVRAAHCAGLCPFTTPATRRPATATIISHITISTLDGDDHLIVIAQAFIRSESVPKAAWLYGQSITHGISGVVAWLTQPGHAAFCDRGKERTAIEQDGRLHLHTIWCIYHLSKNAEANSPSYKHKDHHSLPCDIARSNTEMDYDHHKER